MGGEKLQKKEGEGEVLPFESLKGMGLRGEFVPSLNSFQTLPIHFFH